MDITKALDITNAEYHGNTERISKSGLDLIEQSPLHYWQKYLSPDRPAKKETPALFNGTALHAAILEPDLFRQQYIAFDDSKALIDIGGKNPKATNAYKDFIADFTFHNPGKLILTPDQWKMCAQVTKNVKARPREAEILRSGYAEKSLFFTEPSSGAPCKMRPDWLTHAGFIADVKSTEDASPAAFGKSCINYRYDVQAAFYSDGFHEVFRHYPEAFIFIAVEKEPPYAVAIYFAPKKMMYLGREKYLRNCEAYSQALRSGIWAGYPEEILPVELPGWAFKKY